jgi:hypothetical protein
VKETKSLSLYAQLQLPVSNALLASQGKCSAHVPQRGHGPAAHAQDSGIGTSAFEVQKKKMEMMGTEIRLTMIRDYKRSLLHTGGSTISPVKETGMDILPPNSQPVIEKNGGSIEMEYCTVQFHVQYTPFLYK